MDNFKKRNSGISSLIAYLVIFYLVASIVAIVVSNLIKASGADVTTKSTQNLYSNLVNFITYIFLIIALIIINKGEIKQDALDMKTKKNWFVGLLAGFAIAYILTIVLSNLISMTEQNFKYYLFIFGKGDYVNTESENQSGIVEMLHSSTGFIMAFSAIVLGPICEELVFRKGFFNIIKQKEVAILLSSAFFALIHLTTSFGSYSFISIWLMFLSYFSAGIALGYVYIRFNENVIYSIFAHSLMNLISIVGILLNIQNI